MPRNYTRRPITERFWEKVIVLGTEECWLWQAGLDHNGYGQFNRSKGKPVKAHRFSYELAHGGIDPTLNVLHTCEARYPRGDFSARRCVNPAHLVLGTLQENSRMLAASGRGRYALPRVVKPRRSGAAHAQAALTVQEVAAIRGTYRYGDSEHSTNALARRFRVSQSTIWNVLHRRTYP